MNAKASNTMVAIAFLVSLLSTIIMIKITNKSWEFEHSTSHILLIVLLAIDLALLLAGIFLRKLSISVLGVIASLLWFANRDLLEQSYPWQRKPEASTKFDVRSTALTILKNTNSNELPQ